MHGLAAEKKEESPGSASPKKRKRSSPARESSVSAESASETDADPAEPQPKKKAVLKYKTPVNKVGYSFLKDHQEDSFIAAGVRMQNASHSVSRSLNTSR